MRTIRILFSCHVLALIFGLGGLLIAMPHPELWSGNALAAQVYLLGIHYAGSLHILLAAATMLLFGLQFVGRRKTLIFFAAATTIALSFELLGTGTGFPFGAYEYTSFLGYKVGGRVPFSIPLSWFYMGFTSYILGSALAQQRFSGRGRTVAAVALGAYFLTVWDLALDPAMAARGLAVHFWIWHQTGPYFGMPLVNLLGWTLTGLTFITVSRLLWRENLNTAGLPLWLPFGMYAVNSAFAIALNLGAGLWLPSAMALVLGLLPAFLVWRGSRAQRQPATAGAPSLTQAMTSRTLKLGGGLIVRRHLDVRVAGLEHVPPTGPALIVARHFHHLYDGCLLEARVPRPVHILVALDWVRGRLPRALMEGACRAAEWPVLLRRERLGPPSASAYRPDEARHYLRRALHDSAALLRAGRVLVIFPEAYPTIDPAGASKTAADAFLPFRPGFEKVVELAERDGQTRVPILPTGFHYARVGARWQVTLHIGEPIFRDAIGSAPRVIEEVERRVRLLSAPLPVPAPQPADRALLVNPEMRKGLES